MINEFKYVAAVEDVVSGKCSEPKMVDSALSLNNSGRLLVSSIHSISVNPSLREYFQFQSIRFFKFQLVKQIVWSDREMILKYRAIFLTGPPQKMSLDWPPYKSLDWPPSKSSK